MKIYGKFETICFKVLGCSEELEKILFLLEKVLCVEFFRREDTATQRTLFHALGEQLFKQLGAFKRTLCSTAPNLGAWRLGGLDARRVGGEKC